MTAGPVIFAHRLVLKDASVVRVTYRNLVYAYYRNGEGVPYPG